MAKNKRNRPLQKLIHNLVCYTTSVGLILPTTLVNTYAQQAQSSKPSAVESGMMIFSQLTQTVTQQVGQLRQQAMQAQMNAALMQQIGAPKPTPAKYFNDPNFHFCYVAPAKSDFPEGACSSISSPMDFSQSEIFAQYAQTHISFYDNLITEGQNSTYPKGVQCLNEGKAKLEAEFQNKLNSLQTLADSIKKDLQAFREQNKQIQEKMKDLNIELTGGKASNVDDKIKDLASYFPNECRNIIGTDTITKAKTNGGLIGIKDSMNNNVQAATNFVTNKNYYQNQLTKNVDSLRKQVKNFGLASINEATFEGPLKSKLEAMFVKESQKLQTVYNATAAEIESLGLNNKYKLPALDKNFDINFETFKNNAIEAFRREYISDCVTSAENGVGLSLSDLLRSLRYTGSGRGDGAINEMQIVIQNIVNNDNISMEEKLAQLREVEEKNTNKVVISHTGSNGGATAYNPYEYFKKAQQLCIDRYESDKSNGSLSSQNQKISRVENYLEDLKTYNQKLLPTFSQLITDEIINCKGDAVQAETCDPKGEIFNPKSDKFCIAHASTCSQKVSACYSQADKIVTTKKAELDKFAAQYNANVRTLIAMQEAKLNQIKQKVLADANFIQNYFTGAKFEIPADLFVAMPEMADSKDFGVALLGGGNLDQLEKLPEIIEGQIKGMLAAQADEALKNVEEYIGAQKINLAHNRDKWASLAEKCNGSMDQYSQAMAQQAQKAQESQQESQAGVNDYCNKLKFVAANHPNAACNMGNGPIKLSDDISKVMSAGLNPEMAEINSQLNLICQSYSNEKNTDSDSANRVSQFVSLCQDNDNDWDDVKEKATKTIVAGLALDDSKKREIIDYLMGESSSLPGGIEDEELENNLETLKKKIENAEQGTSPVLSENDLKEAMSSDISDDDKRKLIESSRILSSRPNPKNPCQMMEYNNKYSVLTGLGNENSSSKLKQQYNEDYAEIMENIPPEYKSLARLIDKPLEQANDTNWSRIGQRAQQIGCFAGNDMQRNFGAFGDGAQGMVDILNGLGQNR